MNGVFLDWAATSPDEAKRDEHRAKYKEKELNK